MITFKKKETAEIETGMAGNSSLDQANRQQKLGLVWKIRKKISQIIKDFFHLPFFLLIILWVWGSGLQTDKHLPQSPCTGQFFRWRHFRLPSMSLIFLRLVHWLPAMIFRVCIYTLLYKTPSRTPFYMVKKFLRRKNKFIQDLFLTHFF